METRRENPRLTIRVLSFEHDFAHESKALSFWSEMELGNLGNRGTNILGIDVKFRAKGKDYTLKMSNQESSIEDDMMRWIRPHETIRTFQTAFIKFEDKPEKQIDCVFRIYQTHGAKQIKTK